MQAPQVGLMRTFTTCPVAYDGFGTETIAIVGHDKNGREIREVETPDVHVDWQRNRYWSGGIYMTADPERWAAIKDLILVESNDAT